MSGYDHLFDFVIPKSKNAPERILKAITHPKRDTAESLIHAWTDTKGARAQEARAYAFLNDGEQEVSGGVLEALINYQIRPVVWSRRNDTKQELSE